MGESMTPEIESNDLNLEDLFKDFYPKHDRRPNPKELTLLPLTTGRATKFALHGEESIHEC